jgi:tRNA(fMet)-specific endonuclease VapC
LTPIFPEEFLSPLEILPYDEIAASIYGEIRLQLEKDGEPIDPLDLLIAAQALSRNITLITSNEKEFRRVNNLKVENWVK